jgi:hypothetical protein
MMLKKMIVLSNLVLTKHQNSIKGINTLTIFPFFVFGDNKVKSLIHAFYTINIVTYMFGFY